MLPKGYEFQSETVRKSIEKGRSEGRIAEKAADVLDVLDARGIALSPEQREQILGCTDLEALRQWLRRAATVATGDGLFS